LSVEWIILTCKVVLLQLFLKKNYTSEPIDMWEKMNLCWPSWL